MDLIIKENDNRQVDLKTSNSEMSPPNNVQKPNDNNYIPPEIDIHEASPSEASSETSNSSITPIPTTTRVKGRPPKKQGGVGAVKAVKAGTKKKQTEASTFKNISFEELTAADVECAICLEIYLEPVTYPCGHSCCLACHKQHVEKANLQCPFCRARLSVWNRKASKAKSFVNIPFWEKIQELFGPEVASRQNGDIGGILTSPLESKVLDGQFARPGEIQQDFERAQQNHAAELERLRQIEEKASLQLITSITEEEGIVLPQTPGALDEDLALAIRLQAEFDAIDQPQPRGRRPLPEKAKVIKLSVPVQKQSKLNFPKAPPSAAVASLEEQERQTEQNVAVPGPSTRNQQNTEPDVEVLYDSVPGREPYRETAEMDNALSDFVTSTSLDIVNADYKLAKKLAAEERQQARSEWFADRGPIMTRQKTRIAVPTGAPPQPQVSSKDLKRQRDNTTSSGATPLANKKARSNISSPGQGTLDGFVTTTTSTDNLPASSSATTSSSTDSTV